MSEKGRIIQTAILVGGVTVGSIAASRAMPNIDLVYAHSSNNSTSFIAPELPIFTPILLTPVPFQTPGPSQDQHVVDNTVTVDAYSGDNSVSLSEDIIRIIEFEGSVEEFIQEEVTILGGNVESITDAQIIFLGEDHRSLSADYRQAFIMRALGKDGDIVLLENVQSGEERLAHDVPVVQLPGFNDELTRLQFMGWDDMELHAQAAELVGQSLQIYDEIKIAQENGDDSQLERLNSEFWELHDAAMEIAIVPRNQSLKATLDSLDSELEAGKRIFIIAGSLHYIDDPDLQMYLDRKFDYIALDSTNGE